MNKIKECYPLGLHSPFYNLEKKQNVIVTCALFRTRTVFFLL